MMQSIDGEFKETSTALATIPVSLFGTDDPVIVIEKASLVAKALVDVVKRCGLVATIKGKQYPQVEAWQTMAAMLSLSATCEWTRPIEGGWEARVCVSDRNGKIIASAEAQCTKQEYGKKTWEEYAIRSMAQTRATSKAYRANLGFIMVLAGYCATPAEEMTSEKLSEEKSPSEICPSLASLCKKALSIGIVDSVESFRLWVRKNVQGCEDIPQGGSPTPTQRFAISAMLRSHESPS